jgi:DNA-binding beta-propeller fold protein YncE
MTLRSGLIAATAAACMAALVPAHAGDLLYTLADTATLPSTDSGWDYIKMEPGSNRLFMARDKDGLTVFDVDANKAIATVGNSVGANGPLLLPQYNRGYVAMTDGSFLSFELDSLKPIARLPLDGNGGINSAIHDPLTKRIHAIVGTRPSESTWYTLDAASGKLLGSRTFPFRKMDDPATDGKGRLFAPARRDNLILVLDSETLDEQTRWTVPCNVSKVRYQAHSHRILGACAGDNPMFFALDPDSGRVVASLPIGDGIDGFAIDEGRKRIVTSNYEGTLTVIRQDGPDIYSLAGTVSTLPRARMMTMDERTGRLFVVTARFTLGPPDASGAAAATYHPDSFVVLTYAPQ